MAPKNSENKNDNTTKRITQPINKWTLTENRYLSSKSLLVNGDKVATLLELYFIIIEIQKQQSLNR